MTFYYLVKAKLIRHISGSGEIEFLQFEDKFEEENPIVARNIAFKHYQNYVDVLLQAKQKKYYSDKQAREELKSFIDPGTKTKIQFGESEIEFSDAFGNGIGIFLIVDVPEPDNGYGDKDGEEIFIHGIGDIGFLSEDPDRLIFQLQREYEYYTLYNYDTQNKIIEVVYCSRDEWEEGYREDEPSTYKILETPFDWSGLDKPYWWREHDDEQSDEIQKAPRTLEDIIQEGETNQVEFKPALLYNFSTGKGGIGVKGIIAKSICAFLNSNGGLLIIGVTDNGEPQGLSYDFSLAGEKNERDFFLLEFDQMLEQFLSFSVKSNVSGQFYELNEKDIFVVTVRPNKRRPIFLKGQNGKEFYVRGEASSRRLIDIEELVNYCIEKWGIV
jgi:hypothetical protein